MNKKVMEILVATACFAVLFIFCCLMVIWSENQKEDCIENGGKVIDNVGVYDSCIYGE